MPPAAPRPLAGSRRLHGAVAASTMKPRIFLGSSGQQERLLHALTRGLQDVADVEPWTTVFNPGVSTLDRLLRLTLSDGLPAVGFAHDDLTAEGAAADAAPRQGPPR